MAGNIIEPLLQQNPQNFTVDLSGNDVIIPIPDAGSGILCSVTQFTHFQRLDSPLVLELGVIFPYQFQSSYGGMQMRLRWVDDESNVTDATRFYFPPGVCSLSLSGGNSNGLYLPHPGISDPAWTGEARLSLEIVVGRISMVNVPAQIAGDLQIIPWMRVQHSLELD